ANTLCATPATLATNNLRSRPESRPTSHDQLADSMDRLTHVKLERYGSGYGGSGQLKQCLRASARRVGDTGPRTAVAALLSVSQSHESPGSPVGRRRLLLVVAVARSPDGLTGSFLRVG